MKFISTILFMAIMCGQSFASVNMLSDGTNLGPAQDINVVGIQTTGNGPVKTIDLSAINTTMTVSGVDTIGWTVISSANTFGTSMCSDACVFCINGDVTISDIVSCSVSTADKCLCAGNN